MLNRILIAVDDSDPARRSAAIGFELAETCDASAVVLNVLEPDPEANAGDARERAETLLAETAGSSDAPDDPAETHVAEGQPAAAIAEYAHDHEVDLVVTGRQGRSGLGDRLLGSVAERLLRQVEVPVLTVPGDDSDDIGGYADVLVTTDGSEVAELAAPYAGELAAGYDATLHLLTVVDVAAEAGIFDAGGVTDEFVERLESDGREALQRLERAVGDVDADLRSTVVRGTPHEAIAEYAADNGVDLVVMASEGQTNLAEQRLGSVAARVLRTLDVPILVVPSPD